MTTSNQRLLVYIGSYAETDGPGIYVSEFDPATGKLHIIQSLDGYRNPTFLNVDMAKHRAYSIGEMTDVNGSKAGEASSFSIDPATGKLTVINRKKTVNSTTCHIQRDELSTRITVTSYHGGMVGTLELSADGSIGELLDVQQHAGKGKDPERQDKPHPHSSFYSADGSYLFVQDLGLDQIITYKVDKQKHKLEPHQVTQLHGGAGPRHLVFHPNGSFAYVINELDSTITVLRYDKHAGLLAIEETVSTLPEGFKGENGCAEITISADGAYLYGSNRGHDSIAVYAVDAASGKLTSKQFVSVEGGHPRHFALTPDGKFALVANRDTNNIVMFSINEDGTLQYTGEQLEVSKPVCVIPVYLD